MAGSRTLKLKVLGDAKGAVAALGGVSLGMSSMTKGVIAAGAALAGSATAVGAFAYKAVQQASDLYETQSKIGVVFGDSADAVRKFSQTAAGSLGQSKQTALDAAATFGIFGKSAGLTGQALANFSTDFVKLSADLASFNNTTPEEAIQAIGAALRGESEPLRKYGVLLNDAALRQEAVTLGIYNGSGALTSQQKILAAQSAIYKQTSDAQGDFSRTSDGLANQQRILKASITNLTTSLGTLLLPYFQKMIGVLNQFLTPAVEAFSLSLDSGGSLGQAINFAIASTGDFGKAFLNTIEVVSMSTLNFVHDIAKMGEAVATTTGIIAALTGNTALALKSVAAVLALGAIRNTTNGLIDALPGKFDKWRGAIDNARTSLGLLKSENKYFENLMVLNETVGEKIKKVTVETIKEDDSLKGLGGTVKTLADKMKTYKDAVMRAVDGNKSLADSHQRVKDAQIALTDASDNIGKAMRGVTKSSNDVQKAIDNVAKAQDNTAKARTAYKKSIDEVAKAQSELTDATTTTQKAQDAFNRAVAGYGADSKQGKEAQKDLTEAQRDAEKAGYDSEKAAFSLLEAEQKLAEVRKDELSTPQMVREAEIALAEAKLNLVEAQIKQEDSQIKVTDATTLYDQALTGVKEESTLYKTLLDQLNEAKKDEEQKVLAVTAARDLETEALTRIAESLKGEEEAISAVEDARYALADAEKAVTKAKDDEAQASRDLADAQLQEAKSLLDVAAAQREVTAAKIEAGKMAGGKAALTKVDASLQGVRDIVNNALSLVGETRGMKMMASGGIVTRATPAIIGESGPEAVIPLDKMGKFGGGNVYVTVNAGMGADGQDIGQQIINEIRKAERRSGKVFASA